MRWWSCTVEGAGEVVVVQGAGEVVVVHLLHEARLHVHIIDVEPVAITCPTQFQLNHKSLSA